MDVRGNTTQNLHFWNTTGSYDCVLVFIAIQKYADSIGRIINCAGFGGTAVPAGVPTLPAAKIRDFGARQQDRSGPRMQLEVRVHGHVHRHTAGDARDQVPSDETSQRLLPIQSVFRPGPQLSLQGLPQLPVRHRPTFRWLAI